MLPGARLATLRPRLKPERVPGADQVQRFDMPILLIGSGLVLVLVGLNGDPAKLYALIASDFSGPGSFVYWMTAIIILGALGYIKGLEGLSKLFLILVLIVLFLDNGGFFAQAQAFLKSTQSGTTSTSTPATTGQTQSTPAASTATGATTGS